MTFDLEQFVADARRQNRRDTIRSYLITCGPPILIGIILFALYLTR